MSKPSSEFPLPPRMTPEYGAEQAAEVDRMLRTTIQRKPNNTKGDRQC